MGGTKSLLLRFWNRFFAFFVAVFWQRSIWGDVINNITFLKSSASSELHWSVIIPPLMNLPKAEDKPANFWRRPLFKLGFRFFAFSTEPHSARVDRLVAILFNVADLHECAHDEISVDLFQAYFLNLTEIVTKICRHVQIFRLLQDDFFFQGGGVWDLFMAAK